MTAAILIEVREEILSWKAIPYISAVKWLITINDIKNFF